MAILDARIALFRRKWSDLLSAFKALDMALRGASDASALGFRVPILGVSLRAVVPLEAFR